MRTVFVLLATTLMLAPRAAADGGVVLAQQTVNGLDVTVFAAPAPVRAGPVDVSVLVRDAATGRPELDATVAVEWSTVSTDSPEWMPPCCSMEQAVGKVAATRGHSQNKLLYSAIVPVRQSGPAALNLHVRTPAREAFLTVETDVRPAAPPAAAYWPWLALPPLAIAGFSLHQALARRERSR